MNGGDEVVAASADPSLPLEWRFSQVFGERSAGEEVQEGYTSLFDFVSLCF
jgi:serine/threonine-protein phosphatase 2A regulatory subunit B